MAILDTAHKWIIIQIVTSFIKKSVVVTNNTKYVFTEIIVSSNNYFGE